MPSRKTPTRRSARPAPQAPPAPAMRLIFEYDGDVVRLISQQPVDMVVTGADLAQVHAPGTFVDARDSANRTLARVHARGMSDGSAEVFPEQPGGAIVRVAVERPRGAFTVVVPAPQAAAHVAVVRVAPAAAAPAGARAGAGAASRAAAPLQSTELGSFPLQRKP